MLNYTATSSNDTSDSSVPVAPIVTVLCFISLCSLVGNGLVCLAIYQQPRLRTVMHLPLLSLAIADLFCGLVAMPAYIAKKFVDGRDGEGIVCDVFRFSYFFMEYASVSSLVVVSMERMFTLKYPLKSADPTFSHKIVIFLFLAWFDALVVALLPFIPWDPTTRDSCSYRPTRWWSLMVIHKNVFVPLLIVILCYSYVYKIAILHAKKIRKDNHPGSCFKAKLVEWKQRRKATTTLFIVVGVFLLCWMPSSIYYYVKNVCNQCFDSLIGENEPTFNAVVKILTFANSMSNPLIYWWRSREFRQAFRRVIRGRLYSRGRAKALSETNFSKGRELASFSDSESTTK